MYYLVSNYDSKFLYTAFQYGALSHIGMAPGIDRLLCYLKMNLI